MFDDPRDPVGLRHDALALATQSSLSITPRRAAAYLLHLDDILTGACPLCCTGYHSTADFVAGAAEARSVLNADLS